MLLIGTSAFMSTSIFFAIFYDGTSTILAFAASTVVTALTGTVCIRIAKQETVAINPREAIAVVTLGWFAIPAFGAIPFILDGSLLNPVDAFFESVSGFTTTGSSVLTDIEANSKALLYWRSLTQWLGGMGIIVLFIAILPQLGVGARHLFRSEVPGPITESLKPKLKHTSAILWKIYASLTAAMVLLLMIAGMGYFDSICHALACMASGGFSTKNASVAYWDSTAIDIIVTFFMMLAGVNFGLYYALVRGRIRDFFSNPEFKVYIAINLISIVLISIDILGRHPNLLDALKYSAFQTLSISTTTGFVTDNFDLYPSFSKFLMVFLMFVGGSAGSTAGGLKVSRLMILFKAAYSEVYKAFQPHAVIAVKIGDQPIDPAIIRSVLVFFGLFIFAFVIGTLIMAAFGLDMATASTSVVATLANIGPGLGLVGAVQNYAFIPWGGKLILSLLMIIGRLELFTVLVLLIPDFWKR